MIQDEVRVHIIASFHLLIGEAPRQSDAEAILVFHGPEHRNWIRVLCS